MPLGGASNERKEILVQEFIPLRDDFWRVPLEGQLIGGGSGQQPAGPDVGGDSLAPKSGERSHQCGVAEPRSGFALGGWTLVGEERDESASAKGSMRDSGPGLVVEHRGLVVLPDMFQKDLSGSLMSGSSHPDGIFPEVVEDPSQPFPIAVMHGKKECGASGLCPDSRDLAQRGEVELVPTAGQKKDGLAQGVPEKLACEIRGGVGDLGRPGQREDLDGSRDGERSAKGCDSPNKKSLFEGRVEGEIHDQTFEHRKWVGGHGTGWTSRLEWLRYLPWVEDLLWKIMEGQDQAWGAEVG